jgi:bifunctional non-homologous end joining protein LigD
MKQAAVANFDFIEPMKALPVTDLPVGDWIYELKFDGYRALAFKAGASDLAQPNEFRQRLPTAARCPQIVDGQTGDDRR